LSYAPKGKLLAGVCLIIIGTEGALANVDFEPLDVAKITGICSNDEWLKHLVRGR
jgi:hypothetical protein